MVNNCLMCQIVTEQNIAWAGKLSEAARQLEAIEALLPLLPKRERRMIANILAGRCMYEGMKDKDV